MKLLVSFRCPDRLYNRIRRRSEEESQTFTATIIELLENGYCSDKTTLACLGKEIPGLRKRIEKYGDVGKAVLSLVKQKDERINRYKKYATELEGKIRLLEQYIKWYCPEKISSIILSGGIVVPLRPKKND